MNERIKELMNAAMDYYSNGYVDYPELNPERFAQLIVRECADQIIKKGTDWIDFAPSQTGVRPDYWNMAQHIKQHFGFE